MEPSGRMRGGAAHSRRALGLGFRRGRDHVRARDLVTRRDVALRGLGKTDRRDTEKSGVRTVG